MKKQTIPLANEAHRRNVLSFISTLPLDKALRVTVEEDRRPRSLSQNALMWKWLNEAAEKLADHSGHTSDEIHEFLKAKFLPPTVVEVNGEIREYRTTTKLNTREMHDYMERVYQFLAGECRIYLTLPEEAFA